MKCARTTCNNEEQGYAHKDTGSLYCASCARKINKANHQELVFHARKDDDAIVDAVEDVQEEPQPVREVRPHELTYFVQHFICHTFEELRMNIPFETRGEQGILIGIREYGPKNQDLIGVKWMLIHAWANYVGVYHQFTTSIKKEELNDDGWKLVSYHDSCWTDGVLQWLRYHLARGYLPAFIKAWEWYHVGQLRSKRSEALKLVRWKAYGENGYQRDENFMWRAK
jgi:hypothetical protein